MFCAKKLASTLIFVNDPLLYWKVLGLSQFFPLQFSLRTIKNLNFDLKIDQDP